MKENLSIEVIVERHYDGTFWGTTQNIPGVVTAFGASWDELKKKEKDVKL